MQASRDVKTVLDVLEASSSAAGIRMDDSSAGKDPAEGTRVLVVLLVYNIAPLEHF